MRTRWSRTSNGGVNVDQGRRIRVRRGTRTQYGGGCRCLRRWNGHHHPLMIVNENERRKEKKNGAARGSKFARGSIIKAVYHSHRQANNGLLTTLCRL